MGPILAALLAFIIGLAFAIYGYRLFLVLLPVWGFFAGLWLGASGTQALFGEGFFASLLGITAGIILGLICAVLSYLFYLIGVIIVAGAVGAALGGGILNAMGFEGWFLPGLAALIMAVSFIAVTLLFNLQKYVIIAITAIGGANLLVLSPLLLFGRVTTTHLAQAGSVVRPVLQDNWFWALVWLVLAVAAFFIQVRLNSAYTFSQDQYAEDWGHA